jgi:hypothetical protein
MSTPIVDIDIGRPYSFDCYTSYPKSMFRRGNGGQISSKLGLVPHKEQKAIL